MQQFKRIAHKIFGKDSTTDQEDSFSTTWSSNKSHFLGVIALAISVNGPRNTVFVHYRLGYKGDGFEFMVCVFKVLVGFPILILEFSMSQYSGKSVMEIWDACPLMRGISFCCLIMMFIQLLDDNVFMCQLFRYFIETVTRRAYRGCDYHWNTFECVTPGSSIIKMMKCTRIFESEVCQKMAFKSSYFEFYHHAENHLLHLIKTPQLLHVYILVFQSSLFFLILRKGLKFVQVLGPAFMLVASICALVLSYHVVSHQASISALQNLTLFDSSTLTDISMYGNICYTVFGHAMLGFGGYVALGAQAGFRYNSYKRAALVCLIDLYVHYAYFIFYKCCLGILAHSFGRPAKFLSKYDWFINVLNALEVMGEHGSVFAVIMYLMFYFSGLASMCVQNYVWLCLIQKWLRKKLIRIKTIYVLLLWVVVLFGLSVPLTLGVGHNIRSKWASSFLFGGAIVGLCFFQLVTWVYLYGLPRVIDDLHFMLGFRPHRIVQVIFYLSPFLCFFLFVASILTQVSLPEADAYLYVITNFEILTFNLFPVFVITGYAIYYFAYKLKGSFVHLLEPAKEWRLENRDDRRSRQMFTSKSIGGEFTYRQTRKNDVNKLVDQDQVAYV